MEQNTVPADAGGLAEPNPAGGAGTRTLAVRFVGSGSEYFRIWIVNLLLTLVTLGLYYPFAKVRRLRYFHGATEVDGHPLAFHGDPWKMFRGYVLVGVMFGLYSAAGQVSPMAGGIAFLIVALLWPALWHSSMRFRLANTSWRGLHFRYTGGRGQAYKVMGVPLALAMVSVLLVLLLPDSATAPPAEPPPGAPPDPPDTAAVWLAAAPGLLVLLAMPLFFWLLKRQQHRHYALGQEHSRFDAGLGSFYGLGLKTIGVALLAIVAAVALAFGLGLLMGVFGGGRDELVQRTGLTVVVVMLLSYLLVFALAGGFFTARLQNLVWNRTHSQHLGFRSVLRARSLAGLWLRNTLLVGITLGLYFPFAQVASARMRLHAITVLTSRDPALIVADGQQADEAAAGDAAGDLLGFDIGL